MKLIKYDTLILLVIFAMLYAFACVHGWNPPIEPPPPPIEEVIEEVLIDSCAPVPITSPPQWCIRVSDVTRDICNVAIIKWRGTSKTWIDNFQVVDSSHISHLIEVVDEHINFTGVSMIDKSDINTTVIHLDFVICFTNPTGILTMAGNADKMYIEFDLPQTFRELENDRIQIIRDNIGSIYPPDESTSDEMIQLIQPSWQRVSLYGSQLDSTQLIPVWDHLLFGCKCCAKIDIRGLDISQEYLDQFIYQQIIVNI